MKQFLIIFSITFALFTSLAKDIKPIENVGRVIVKLPDLTVFPKAVQEEYKNKFVALMFRDQIIQPNVEYYVDSGSGCSRLSLHPGLIFSQNLCGTISPGQLTVLQYTAFHLNWDTTVLKTDVGPIPVLFVSKVNGQTREYFPVKNSPLDFNLISKNLFISGEGEFSVSFNIPNTFEWIDGKLFPVKTPTTISLKPKDKREEISVNFLNGPAKFGIGPESDAYIVFRSREHNIPNKSLKPKMSPLSSGILTNGNILNFVYLDPNKGNQIIKYFSVNQADTNLESSKWVLEAVVNETRWPLSLQKGLKQSVPIEIINVNDFQTGKPGLFKFARKNLDDWTPILKVENVYGDLIEQYRPTSSSLLLFPGYEYQFEFFVKDDLGELLKQESVILDLK